MSGEAIVSVQVFSAALDRVVPQSGGARGRSPECRSSAIDGEGATVLGGSFFFVGRDKFARVATLSALA